MTDYATFLASKRRTAPESGFDITDADINPRLFDWQRDIVRWSVRRGKASIFCDTGLGKAQPINEVVLVPGGWREIGSLEIGDSIIAGDGSVTWVSGIYPQGVRDVARVTFNDGAEVLCDYDHLWSVATDLDLSRGIPHRILTLREIESIGLESQRDRLRWRIPMIGGDKMPTVDLPVDPYILGVLIGDGCFRTESIAFTNPDSQIADEVSRRLPDGFRLATVKGSEDQCPSFRLSANHAGTNHPNSIRAFLSEVGLWNKKSIDKFIPPQYMIASRNQRIDLLNGLMDTDGYVSAGGTVQYSSSSALLANSVRELVWSIGGTSRTTSKIPSYTHKGEKRQGERHYTLTLAIPNDVQPFLLDRKAARYSPREKYQPQRKIASIVPAGQMECVCISVDHPSHLYVTRDYVVTHNTLQQLEWASLVHQHTGRDVLILAPLAVSRQTLLEAGKFGITATIPVNVASSQESVQPGITITNYEKLHKFDASHFVGVVLDESSIIKHQDSKTRDLIISTFARTPYKLACTATPAPNDQMELGNHAEFMGVMSRAEMLAMFFTHDGGDTSKWRLKKHAERDFWRWMASWSVMIRNPADIGYDGNRYVLPELTIHQHEIDSNMPAHGRLFAVEAKTLKEQREARRQTISGRCEFAASLANADAREPWVIWCGLNDESKLTSSLITNCVEVTGSMVDHKKESAIIDFGDGIKRAIVSKSSITGFGLNWQHCSKMAFVGLSHSYEQFYQAVRRCWRFGQTKPVDVHIITSDRDGAIVANLQRKQAEADEMVNGMVAAMAETSRDEIRSAKRDETKYVPQQIMELPKWI